MTLQLEESVNNPKSEPLNHENQCPECLVKIENSPKYCSNCGLELFSEPEAPDAVEEPPRKLLYAYHVYAGFLKRLTAYIIDSLIISVGVFIYYQLTSDSSSLSLASSVTKSANNYLFYVIWWGYFTFSESSAYQATFGKRILKIKVVDLNGERLTFLHAGLRQICGALSALSFGIGYLLSIFTEHKQTLHDYLADALVVNISIRASQIKLVNRNRKTMSRTQTVILATTLLLITATFVFWKDISKLNQYFLSDSFASKVLNENLMFQQSLVKFHQKAQKWPENVEQLSQYVSVAVFPDSQFILTGQGDYHQIFSPPHVFDGHMIMWQRTGDQNQKWRCTSHSIDFEDLPAGCRD